MKTTHKLSWTVLDQQQQQQYKQQLQLQQQQQRFNKLKQQQ